MERRTIKGWVHFLENPDAQLTLSEFMALCLLHSRDEDVKTRLGTEHLEGMVGTLDEFLHASNSLYQQLADRRAKPVALPDREAS